MGDPATRVGAAATSGGSAFIIQGKSIAIPVEVRDAASITAMYLVPTPAVRRLIPHPELHILELFPGRAVCVLAAIEYRDNDLGRYNEFAVNFFVRHGGRRPTPLFGLLSAFRNQTVGAYVHWLPVTTSFSRDAGRDIWGFPKIVAEIVFQDEHGWRRCTVASGGALVLTFAVRRNGRRQLPDVRQDTFASRDGTLFRTPSAMSGTGVGIRLGGATLTLGDHPLAADLRGLGLPRRALLSTSTETMRATFQAPQRL